MVIYYSPKFEKEYRKLPLRIKRLAEKKEKVFRTNFYHPSLKTNELGGRLKSFWSFSINYQYRIIFEFAPKNIVWFHSVGTHKIYR